jgi:hypothetical protein
MINAPIQTPLNVVVKINDNIQPPLNVVVETNDPIQPPLNVVVETNDTIHPSLNVVVKVNDPIQTPLNVVVKVNDTIQPPVKRRRQSERHHPNIQTLTLNTSPTKKSPRNCGGTLSLFFSFCIFFAFICCCVFAFIIEYFTDVVHFVLRFVFSSLDV